MLLTHIYFNGQFKQTIELYKQAFNATVKTLIEDSCYLLIVHNEIVIHNKFLILNDFGNKMVFQYQKGISQQIKFKRLLDFIKSKAISQQSKRDFKISFFVYV